MDKEKVRKSPRRGREARLADALRANLKRRKLQARARAAAAKNDGKPGAKRADHDKDE